MFCALGRRSILFSQRALQLVRAARGLTRKKKLEVGRRTATDLETRRIQGGVRRRAPALAR